MSDATTLPLDAITIDARLYPRLALDPERIAVLRDLYDSGGSSALPPVDVVLDGDLAYCADGAHRCAAAELLGWADIPVRVIPVPDGFTSAETTYLHALETAVATAKPLSRAERKAAARRLLNEHPGWSDREIARRAGVSHTTVGALRNVGAAPEPPDPAEGYLTSQAAERAAASLVRGIASAWDARGLTDLLLRRMPGTLAAALRDRFGDDAPVWAERLERWAAEAGNALARER